MRFGFLPVRPAVPFDATVRLAQLAESVGFGALWFHEHHVGSPTSPSPMMTIAVVAPRTAKVRLGTNMLLLPLHHPLTVAEEGAMLQDLSGGRFQLGVTAGYSPEELAAFAVDAKQRGRCMEEGLSLIRRVWRESGIDLAIERSRLSGFTLSPGVGEAPPPIYVGATTPGGLRRAARLGDGLVFSLTERRSDFTDHLPIFRAELARLDVDPTTKRTAANRVVHVVADRRRALEARATLTRAFLAMYDRWGHRNVTGLDAGQRSDAVVAAEHFVVGEPSECVEAIERYAELGIGEIVCAMGLGNPDLATIEASVRLLGERVLPRFA